MEGLTWRQVLVRLSEMSPSELDQNATIQLTGDEFMPVTQFTRSRRGGAGDGILNHGHWFLVPKFGRKDAMVKVAKAILIVFCSLFVSVFFFIAVRVVVSWYKCWGVE